MSNGGFATALAIALGAKAGEALDGVDDQAEMFDADAAAPSMLPAADVGQSGPKGGRPKGRRNRSTEAIRELFLAKFRHPMMVLGELTARSPAKLAEELGLYLYHEGKMVLDLEGRPVLAVGEALKAQEAAAIALLPYLGQKLPMAVEITPPNRGVVVIGDLPTGDGVADDLALPIAPIEQNQRVIEAEIVRPADMQSHEQPKPMNKLTDFADDN